MLRLLFGVFLLPLSAALIWAALKGLAGAALGASSGPFVAGMVLTAAAWLTGRAAAESKAAGRAGRLARWVYVAGHELTHALAAWGLGGKVFGISVGERGGHVDMSERGAFVALAPYCIPFYALMVIAGYRAILYFQPSARAESLFLLLMGAALAFHFLMTWQTLTEARQPDLQHAGGVLFSLALIGAANGLALLLLLKVLFPHSVTLGSSLRNAGLGAWGFWLGAWKHLGAPAARGLWRRILALAG